MSEHRTFQTTRPNLPVSPIRAKVTRSAAIYILFTTLFLSNVVLAVSLLMSPEITTLIGEQENNTNLAYQDRILQLRMEVDRLHSQQYLQTGDLNLKMQELMQRQQLLTEQYQYIRILADKADELGLPSGQNDADLPELEPASATNDAGSTIPDVDFITSSVDRMFGGARFALTSISEQAEKSTNLIVAELRAIGIPVTLPDQTDLAMGGPALPAIPGLQTENLAERANDVLLSLERFQYARSVLDTAPISNPLTGSRRISSYFGNRTDPFNGSRKFHSGLDYPAPMATPVYSAGAGKVLFAGRRGSLGIMVEIEHENGLITRFAHLSAKLVETGQIVQAGDLIAKVGSTGRSTGPHLHFEIRRNATPVNPLNYLRVAQRLSDYIS